MIVETVAYHEGGTALSALVVRPAVPPRAAAALRVVEQRRCYARSRLELLDEAAGESSTTRGDGDPTPAADGLPAPTPAS